MMDYLCIIGKLSLLQEMLCIRLIGHTKFMTIKTLLWRAFTFKYLFHSLLADRRQYTK